MAELCKHQICEIVMCVRICEPSPSCTVPRRKSEFILLRTCPKLRDQASGAEEDIMVMCACLCTRMACTHPVQRSV